MAPRMPSTFETPQHFKRFKHFTDAPPNSSMFEKLSHALPLPLHIILVGLSTSWSVLIAILTFFVDGPLRETWDIVTVVVHAFLRAFVMSHPPQGRHSITFLKSCTDFTVPPFAAAATVAVASVRIRGDALLRGAVRNAVGLEPLHTMASTTVERKDSAINDDASTDDQSDFRTDDDGYSSSQQSTADHYHKEGFNPATLRKVDGEWVVSWSFVPKPKAESRVVLYIHGGAGYLLSPRTHRGLIAQISKHAECPVYAVDYRLCPESTFPSAIEDAVAAYCALLGENHRPPGFHGRHHFLGRGFNARIAPPKSAINVFSDFELISPKSSSVNKKKPSYFRASGRPLNLHPSQIVVAGDSSGGCITMQFLVTLKALGLPMPAGGILLSPFVDNELKADSWRRNQHCDYLSVNQLGLRWVVRNIACNPLITDNHPFFSPAHANLSGLCPLLIQVGDAEVLTDDSVKLHENAIAGGVKSQLELYRDMFHVFQAFPMIAAADVAIKRMGLFVKGLPMQVQTATPFSTFDNMRLPQDATFKTTRNLHDANGDPLSRGTRPVSSSSSLMQALGKLRGNDTESMPPSSTLQNTITSYDIETRRWLWGRKMSPSISSSMLKTESGAGSSVTLVPEQSGVDSFRLTKASGPAEAVVITVRNWGRVVEEERVSTVRYIAPVHH